MVTASGRAEEEGTEEEEDHMDLTDSNGARNQAEI